jgi:hypothetical protein
LSAARGAFGFFQHHSAADKRYSLGIFFWSFLVSKSKVKKFAFAQAIAFWLGLIAGMVMLWSIVVGQQGNAPSGVFYTAFCVQLAFGLAFIVTSGFLASGVNKSPILWVVISIFLGPIGFILAYAMLSSTAKKFLATPNTAAHTDTAR